MAIVQICVFNPVTTFIDQVMAASVGPGVAGQPVILNSLGLIDPSLLGQGVIATAGENLSAGYLINLYSQGGTLHAQRAYAAASGTAPSGDPYPRPANGFVSSLIFTGSTGAVSFSGTFVYIDANSEFSASDIGSIVFLSAVTPGGVTKTPPSSGSPPTGHLDQSVGYVVGYGPVPHQVTVAFSAAFLDFTQINGILPINKGGTNATTAAAALISLIGGSPSTNEALIWSGTAWVPAIVVNSFNGRTGAVVPTSNDYTFGQLASGANATATMTVGTGATLTFTGSGVVNASQIQGNPISSSAPVAGQALVWNGSSWAPSSAAVTSFTDITSGTNTVATMVVGPGAVLTFSGAGSPPSEGEINANFLYGVQIVSTPPTTGQTLTALNGTSASWQTINYALLSGATFTGAVSVPSLNIFEHLNAEVFGSPAGINTDLAGTVTIAAGTSAASHTFNTPFNYAPVVIVTPTSSPSAAGIGTYWVTYTVSGSPAEVTGFAVNCDTPPPASPPESITFNYVVIGTPN